MSARLLSSLTSRRTLRGIASLLVITSVVLSALPANAARGYPVGVANSDEPSGMAPPTANSLIGYHQTYVDDFNGSQLPKGWYTFNGVPGGDTSGQFSSHHILVTQGLLRLKTYQDPAFKNHWVTAGLCQCGKPETYGAYFVRSRVTGSGTNSVALLWPASNKWPPEIDFSENLFYNNLTTATVHWSSRTDFHVMYINMLKWHTWGVIWSPSGVLDVVDGHPWHQFNISGAALRVPMVLNFEQRTTCPSTLKCPTASSAMLIDWVAEYQKS